MVFRHAFLSLLCLPLALSLVGCPADNASAAGRVPAGATAPALTPEQQAAQQKHDDETRRLLEANQHSQRLQQVINTAEQNYNDGVSSYNNNHLEAARQDFDAAVDAILSSEFDLHKEPTLSDEFDSVLDRINSLEMVALKQGNGFSPKQEAAPLDAANEVTFPPNPELVGKVAAELQATSSDLPLVSNDYVAGWISYFQNSPGGRAHLVASLRRAGKYKTMISRILRENGVPQDLIYQAVAESGFQPQALNARSGAGGMWQFMPFGNYGLARNGYFDERFDPEKSSIAYAKYMKMLYNQFGDWYLAMAAYDWGPGNVQRAVSRTGYADYWELYKHNALPAETKAYVPGIIAAIIVAKNPAQYGLTNIVPDAPVVSDTVTTSYAIDLRLVADVTDSTVAEIVELNPALLRLSTPNEISYDLHIPPGTHDLYSERLKDIPENKRNAWRFHIVKAGETLESIAADLHAKSDQIAEVNDVTTSSPLEVDDELVVPISAVTSASGQQRYTLRRGDTLVSVADRFGISVEQLHAWNHISASGRITPGHSLYVAEPVRLAPSAGSSRRSRGHSHSSGHASHASSASRTSSKHASSHASTAHAPAHTTLHSSTPSSKKKKKP